MAGVMVVVLTARMRAFGIAWGRLIYEICMFRKRELQ